jgi:hypothetical protein
MKTDNIIKCRSYTIYHDSRIFPDGAHRLLGHVEHLTGVISAEMEELNANGEYANAEVILCMTQILLGV